jgi:membrane carboxypeptidase/penicillin-binding protein
VALPRSAAPTPATAAPPVQAAAPQAPSAVLLTPARAPANPARDPEAIEQRLMVLKRLHANGLISDDEYQQKRKEILQQL